MFKHLQTVQFQVCSNMIPRVYGEATIGFKILHRNLSWKILKTFFSKIIRQKKLKPMWNHPQVVYIKIYQIVISGDMIGLQLGGGGKILKYLLLQYHFGQQSLMLIFFRQCRFKSVEIMIPESRVEGTIGDGFIFLQRKI